MKWPRKAGSPGAILILIALARRTPLAARPHAARPPDQEVFHLRLTLGGATTQIDDTISPTSSEGVILVSDRDGETVCAISKSMFAPGAAYSATPTSVGELNMDTGVITPVVTGMVSPHGMVFIRQ